MNSNKCYTETAEYVISQLQTSAFRIVALEEKAQAKDAELAACFFDEDYNERMENEYYPINREISHLYNYMLQLGGKKQADAILEAVRQEKAAAQVEKEQQAQLLQMADYEIGNAIFVAHLAGEDTAVLIQALKAKVGEHDIERAERIIESSIRLAQGKIEREQKKANGAKNDDGYKGKKYKKCGRCSGTGRHSHGACFGCNGAGSKKTIGYIRFQQGIKKGHETSVDGIF